MFDFISFSPMGKINGYSQEFIDVGKLPKDIFASTSDIQKGRGLVKKVKYFHYQLYSAEQGFLKLMAEHKCALVIALSDFFGVPDYEVAKRLERAKVLVRIAHNTGVRVRIFSLAKNANGIRDENEIYWIGKMLGMSDEQLREMIDEKVSW